MDTNLTPFYDQSDNPTGCCPRFDPSGWDGQNLHFKNKRFVRATTRSLMHIPLNMGTVFSRVLQHLDDTGAVDPTHALVLSRDLSAFGAEHLFAVTKDVPDEEMTTLSGDYVTKVFDGPYSQAKNWMQALETMAKAKGSTGKSSWFFYTTCPKCAKTYGHNYVVGLAEV
ncbi:MAG: hydrolase [Paracoccaceae bacterium]